MTEHELSKEALAITNLRYVLDSLAAFDAENRTHSSISFHAYRIRDFGTGIECSLATFAGLDSDTPALVTTGQAYDSVPLIELTEMVADLLTEHLRSSKVAASIPWRGPRP